MKYFCEACERLVPPAAFRVEDGLLVVKCSRCKVEMRGVIEVDGVATSPAVAASKRPITAPVIPLDELDAEPDPIENEPTRRMAVPAELLRALEEETRQNREREEREEREAREQREAKEQKEREAREQREAKEQKEREAKEQKERERPRDKGPVPVLEPAPDKAPERVKVSTFPKVSDPKVSESSRPSDSSRAAEPPPVLERTKTPAMVKVSEVPKAPERTRTPESVKASESVAAKDRASRSSEPSGGASNLTVLKLSDVQRLQASAEPASPPVPVPAPAPVTTPAPAPASASRASGPSLRVVRDSGSSPAVGAAAATSDDPFMPPVGFCPKCIGPRKEGTGVCPFCGLDFGRFRPDEFRPSPIVSSAWIGVQELWESKSAHDKVLTLASARGELPSLGRLYRVRLARDPEDAMALRGREEVLRLAAASSMFLATPPPDKGTKIRTAGLGIFFFLLIVLLVAMGVRVWKMSMGES